MLGAKVCYCEVKKKEEPRSSKLGISMKHLYGRQSCNRFNGHLVGDYIFLYVVDIVHHPLYLDIKNIAQWLFPLYFDQISQLFWP
jgi:hypothetical protein